MMQAADPSPEEAGKLLERFVSQFNACVEKREFAPCLDMFEDDAALEFEGVPERGPLEGRAAIAARWLEDPPDDQVRVVRWRYENGRVVAQFLWKDIPEARGGVFVMTLHGERISRLVIAFGGPSAGRDR